MGSPGWLLLIAAIGTLPAVATEEAPHRVVQSEGRFEVREYAPVLLAEVEAAGTRNEAADRAFGELFGYISGQNRPGQKIAMTTPVLESAAGPVASGKGQSIAMTVPVTQEPAGGLWRIGFVMPSSFSRETLPIPTSARVTIRALPARKMVAVRFSGGTSDASVAKNEAALQAWARAKGFRLKSAPVVAVYNPPFIPPFFRRNEVLFEIE